jgi:hypothetical protein
MAIALGGRQEYAVRTPVANVEGGPEAIGAGASAAGGSGTKSQGVGCKAESSGAEASGSRGSELAG